LICSTITKSAPISWLASISCDFSIWTGAERLKEANAVGAKAIVSACPWCKRNFWDAAKAIGDKIEVYDIIELVQKAM
jgi:hypothetical protein